MSKACTSICMWVRAMHKYHFVAKGVAPKRERLRIATEELQETQRILDAAMARLAEVEEGIATLQAKYEDCVRKKEELENKCAECEARLVRADKVRVILLIRHSYPRKLTFKFTAHSIFLVFVGLQFAYCFLCPLINRSRGIQFLSGCVCLSDCLYVF